ncbi:MAG: chemotaxis protein CheA [Xanthomonadaceae bacterium]|nr:chemotaxis protein CheA [Xanthomonadaceae bacterium]
MSGTFETEILADFLLEAGELVAALGDQLLALEAAPDAPDLLNAVFRAFHTVKGGAGFLSVEPMVALCHRGEDLLNEARSGRVRLTPEHIDALLQALDHLQQMMRAMQEGTVPVPAPSALLERLSGKAAAPAQSPAVETQVAPPPVPTPAPAPAASADAVDQEFDALLAAVASESPGTPLKADEPIDDSEFEALLDELYGSKGAPGKTVDSDAGRTAAPMTDDDFEALLDSLHGSGAAPGAVVPAPAPPVPVPAPVPAPVAAPTSTALTAAPVPSRPAAAGTGMARSAAPAEATIRVDTVRLDALVNLIGELVLVRNRLVSLTATSVDEAMERAVAELHRVADDLQLAVMRTRMLPVGKLFSRFPRIVRDLARQLGKQIDLVLEGEDTDLDRNLVDALADPMVHLVRNAVDHGIELPEARERVGKPATGTVRLIAAQEGERIIIRVRDDGRGMDAEVLRIKAVEKGLLVPDQAARLSEAECYDLIFLAGFSTRSEVSDISGRGVGMDVVKTRVGELGGTLVVDSRLGHGSEIRVSLPLTLATLRALMVRVCGRVFAIPMINVVEVFEFDRAAATRVDDREVIAHRQRALPLRFLAPWIDPQGEVDMRSGHVVVVHVGHRQVGCVVDEVLGREEMVVKPLGHLLRGVAGVTGATITGDGKVALVLDVAQLPDSGARHFAKPPEEVS